MSDEVVVVKELEIKNRDDDGDPSYYGFEDQFGNWKIMKVLESEKTYSYARGNGSYLTNWANRTELSYT